MKTIICFLLPLILNFSPEWHYNLGEAREQAKKENRFIILNFSGSDWCGPCIRMHKEIFDSEPFGKLAAAHLVLVRADFPRLKKNQLPPKQQELNNSMADQYNSKGKFPYTLLLDADGKVLKDWEGFPNEKPEDFCREIATITGIDQ